MDQVQGRLGQGRCHSARGGVTAVQTAVFLGAGGAPPCGESSRAGAGIGRAEAPVGVTDACNSEWIDLNNVSSGEDEDDPPEVIVNAHTHPSPLQTTTSTLLTDPFATRKRGLKSTSDVQCFLGRTQTLASAFAFHARMKIRSPHPVP
ncbi:uncharacterized protein F5147DRAFT_779158 [Suillus discolor]|uniref:Uncharacterized protein n=1 Tax=Suillus discolor TaxID=1912936 RepID=A0A9P7EXB8_9AGAM|nr:uncharacterized protein F5147DRAFT_779158 [Suillus discolor]KAG2093880.1 hypothetical protein F5147DRAFT_779158 [Suillus discolor]